MKNLLLINGDMDKGPMTRHLMDAYLNGALAADAVVKEIAIIDLKFNANKQFGNRIPEMEPDLKVALEKINWAHHIVLFCPVSADVIPIRLSGFFERIFGPDNTLRGVGQNTFSGKTARIVSILDQLSWEEWLKTKKPTYHSIKRVIFERAGLKPVRTCTIGHLYSTENNYSKKWLSKMYEFGNKLQ